MGRYRMILRGLGFLVLVCFHVSQVTADPSRGRTVEQVYPSFATHILKSAKMVEMGRDMLLETEGIDIRESRLNEIVAKAKPALRPGLKKNLFFLLEQEAMKKLLVRGAHRSGISLQGMNDGQAIQAYLNHLVQGVTVSDREAKAFYEENKGLVGGVPFEQVEESIQQVLLERKKAHAMDDHIQDLVRRVDININEKWVRVHHRLATDNPVDKARMSGKPTMLEFGATGCIPCDKMQPILSNLKEKYKDRLNVLFVQVREEQILGARYGIRSIPVQVFFDGSGRETFRHVGFFPQDEVEKILASMGVL